jgi:hypothetical protein
MITSCILLYGTFHKLVHMKQKCGCLLGHEVFNYTYFMTKTLH